MLKKTITGSDLLFSYDGPVHKKNNENAVDPTNSKIDGNFKKQIGLVDGINTELSKDSVSKKIEEWIAFGGEAEDYGFNGSGDFTSTRAFNHFHNPLQDWNATGLDTAILETLYSLFYSRDPVSAVAWSLDQGAQDFSENRTGDWS